MNQPTEEETPKVAPFTKDVRTQIEHWIDIYKGYPTNLGHNMESLLVAYDKKVRALTGLRAAHNSGSREAWEAAVEFATRTEPTEEQATAAASYTRPEEEPTDA